jgi:energy-converting hydrogenase Eha subunit B
MVSNTEAVPAVVMGVMILFYLVFLAAVVALTLVVWWRICRKAGYSGWLGLLMIVPIANIVLLLVLAFAEWPVLKELRALKEGSGSVPLRV